MPTTVPNTFADKAGDVPADELDQNFDALATAIDDGDETAKSEAIAAVRGDVAENLNTLEKLALSLSIARQESHDAVTSTFIIGDVEEAEVANADIRGTPTERILDLWLPKGDQGDAGPKGDKGDKGDTGNTGSAGGNGWTWVPSNVADGARIVQQIVDWTGGQGAKPQVGQFVGPDGLVTDIADAVDIRGGAGADGIDGADGAPGADGAAGGNFHAKGPWSNLVQYEQFDMVERGGSSYYANDSNIGSEPPSAHWQLFARKGDNGDDGAAGEPGEPGADGTDGTDGVDGANGLGFATVPYVANGVALVDAAGYIFVYFKGDRIEHVETNAWRARLNASAPALYASGEAGSLAFTDSQDYVAWRITPEHIYHVEFDKVRTSLARARVPARSLTWDDRAAMADTVCICMYGQSLNLGYYSKPFLTGAGLPYALRFNGGVRPIDDSLVSATIYASLETYRERVNTIRRNSFTPTVAVGDPDRGETPGGGALRMWAQLMRDEEGIDVAAQRQRILLFAHGQGGQSVAQLSKASAAPASGIYYQDAINAYTFGKSLTDADARSFAAACVFWVQGEENTQIGSSQASYEADLVALQSTLEADVQAITGIASPLPFITYQTPSHPNYSQTVPAVALGQLHLHETSDRFAMAAPCWPVDFDYANKPHLTNRGSIWLGAYFGLAFKRWFYDGIKPKVVNVASSVRQGKNILLRMNVPGERLVLDNSYTAGAAIANYGIQVVTSTNVAVTVLGVDLVSHDTIRISCATAPGAGCKVRHAWQGDALRGLGGIRDDQGDRIVFDPGGLAIKLHNWAPIFEAIIP